MVKKLMTGLAISVGAGIALTVTSRVAKAGRGPWRPAKSDGIMTPVTVRVHRAIPRERDGFLRDEAGRPHSETNAVAIRHDDGALAVPLTAERSLELAEMKIMIDTLDNRSNEMLSTVNQRIDDLQNHLPRFIDVKVTSRIREMEERLRTEFQDDQSRTLDSFLKTLDQKVLPRIALVEDAIGAQGAEIGVIRQRLEKTDVTLDRVLERIEKAVNSMSLPASSYPGYASPHIMENVMAIHQKAVA